MVGRGSDDLTIITYHQFGDRPSVLGNVTSPDAFAAQLEFYSQNYNAISLADLLAGDIPDNALLITIDDAYRSVAEVAAPALKGRGMPALFFVNPLPIKQAFVPLQDVIASACGVAGWEKTAAAAFPGARTKSIADLLATASRAADAQTVKSRVLSLLGCSETDLHATSRLFLRVEDLRRLADCGVEIANHTMTHVRCGPLGENELRREIVDAKSLLEELAGTRVRAFAFPWGSEADATPLALQAIRGSGHEAIFLMHARRNVDRPASDIWYRTLVTNETGWRLSLQLNVLPRLRSWKSAWQSSASPGQG
jgi:peptidoglycan/xylan/chitin deacetylase (PgdA/CDA1 family)